MNMRAEWLETLDLSAFHVRILEHMRMTAWFNVLPPIVVTSWQPVMGSCGDGYGRYQGYRSCTSSITGIQSRGYRIAEPRHKLTGPVLDRISFSLRLYNQKSVAERCRRRWPQWSRSLGCGGCNCCTSEFVSHPSGIRDIGFCG